MARIECRAKITKECFNGREEREVYDSGTQSEDGTWDGVTVVCDPCYVALGAPPNEELPLLLAAYRAKRKAETTLYVVIEFNEGITDDQGDEFVSLLAKELEYRDLRDERYHDPGWGMGTSKVVKVTREKENE